MGQPIFYWNESMGKVIPQVLNLSWKITAAKTISSHIPGQNSFALTTFDAISAQSTIDNFLGTTNEFLVAAFDATAMGTDAFACILNMRQQVADLSIMQASVYSSTYLATTTNANASKAAALTASTLETAVAVGAYGNVALKLVASGLDALTAGIIRVQLSVIFK